MKNCGIENIDKEREVSVAYATAVIGEGSKASKERIESAENKIMNFRMKLAYNRGTEALEGNFGWTPVFDDLITKLKVIKTHLP